MTTMLRWISVLVLFLLLLGASNARGDASGPVVAGNGHSCALVSDGTARCWGNSDFGQLGDGSTTDRAKPVTVSGLVNATALVAGNYHTCALVNDGTVRCWGSNYRGQLGDSSTTDRATPVTVVGLSNATAVAAGNQHTCAITNGGTVRCWGYNVRGQLGDGSTTDRTSPVAVSGLVNATALASGGDHTCALISGGTVRCWGYNLSGELGDGSTTNRTTPVTVSGLVNATALAAGGYHTCAVISGGTMRCWGSNDRGGLGDGTTTQRNTPVTVTGLVNATALAAGSDHTCALISGGTMRCWGGNGYGQLGDSTTTQRTTPVTVSGLVNATALAAGSRHTCTVISGGTVRCWGDRQYDQLGDGSTTNPTTPTKVIGLVNATALAAGEQHTCALINDGTARCWGNNDIRQLGDGSTTARSTPVTVSGLVNATALAAGNYHTCAIINDGTVRCWGDNRYGQLGDGTTTDRTTPVTVSGLINATALAAGGGSHTCALINDGTVRCWGSNFKGQLGDGSTTDRTSPVTVSGLTNATALAAGNGHTCAVVSGGTLSCWGGGGYGQLGNGSTTDRTTPVTVSGLVNATALAAGEYHTCALISDGTMRCWGWNIYGQLGDGSVSDRTTPVTVSGLIDATTLAAGLMHTCAAISGGTLRCWGANDFGQLGDGTTANRTMPVTVSELVNATTLKARFFQTCALLDDGSASCWGYNLQGQLGNGESGIKTTPVDVYGTPFVVSYTLTYTADANGSIAGVSPQTVIAGDDGSTVTAVANAGYQFVQWSDTSASNPRSDTNVISNINVTAQFLVRQYTVTFDSQGGSPVDAITQDFGSSVTVPAAPTRANYTFSTWNTASDGSGTSYIPDSTFSMPSNNSTLFAIWAINQYTLTYTANANGSINGVSPQTVDHGSDASPVMAAAATGYHFVDWSDGITANPRTDTNVTGNISVSANFANVAPNISVVGNLTILEDSETTVVTVTLSDLETSGADLQLTAQSSSTGLIPHPAIDINANPAERTVSFAPVSNGNGGPVTITLIATDGAAATFQRTFLISVTPVNDAPSLTLGANPTHPAATTGAQSAPGFAVVSLGPPDEEAVQSVADFLIDSVIDPDGVLVASSLDIANDGTLGYTLNGIGGTATITARVRDNGGTVYNGVDTSSAQQFTIEVAPGADLQIAKTNHRGNLLNGETTIYAIVVANAGPNTVAGARLVDPLPSTLINGSWACIPASSTATCPSPDANSGDLDVLVDLGVNQYLRFDVMADVSGSVNTLVINTATVTLPVGITALNPEDDSATDTDLIVPVGVFMDGFEAITQHALTVPGAAEALAD